MHGHSGDPFSTIAHRTQLNVHNDSFASLYHSEHSDSGASLSGLEQQGGRHRTHEDDSDHDDDELMMMAMVDIESDVRLKSRERSNEWGESGSGSGSGGGHKVRTRGGVASNPSTPHFAASSSVPSSLSVPIAPVSAENDQPNPTTRMPRSVSFGSIITFDINDSSGGIANDGVHEKDHDDVETVETVVEDGDINFDYRLDSSKTHTTRVRTGSF